MSYSTSDAPKYPARSRAAVKADLKDRNAWAPRHAHDDRGRKFSAPHVLSPKCLLTNVCDEYLGDGFSVQAEKRPSQARPKPRDGRPAFGPVRTYRVQATPAKAR